MRKRNYIIVLFLLAFIVTTAANATDKSKMYEIEPGWRVGLITFNMTMPDVKRVYGDGKTYEVSDPDRSHFMKMLHYKQLGLDVLFRNGQVHEIHVNYPLFSIKKVVKVGTSTERVKEVMGGGFIRKNYRHSHQTDLPEYRMIYSGVAFDVKGERVVKIIVKRKF